MNELTLNQLPQPILTELEERQKNIVFADIKAKTKIGEELKRAQDLLAKNGYGCFGDWLEFIGIGKSTAYNYINRYETIVQNLDNRNFDELPDSIIYEYAKTSTPPETKQAIEDGEIKTIKELQNHKQKLKEAESKITELKNHAKELEQNPIIKEVEKIPDDYHKYKETAAKMQNEALNFKRQLEDKKLEIDRVNKEKDILERKARLNQEESNKYESLKKQIENLSKEKNDLGRQIKARTELSGLVVRIEHTLKTELAPIKYSRAISEASSDEIVLNNLRDITQRVQEWVDDMKQYISDPNIVEVLNYEDIR